MLGALAFTSCNKSSDTSNQYLPALYTSPTVNTVTPTSLEVTAYVIGFLQGTISSYGVCYSTTNQTPSVSDSKTSLTTANLIHYISDITGLTANTTYYIRAYAIHTSGTFYGNVITIKTPTTTYSIAGTTSTYAGNGTTGLADGTPATSASFNSPQAVVADAAGNLYVADTFNNLIRKVSASGAVTTLAGAPAAGFVNGTGTAARFYSPQAIAIDASGNLYVSDVGNNAIRKITQGGVVTTLAGGSTVTTGSNAGYADGSGTIVRFYNPAGLVCDAAGNVFVAERGNHTIRKITPAGVTSTYAGLNTPGFVDYPGYQARFNTPTGLAIDASGNLYVADAGNNVIRKIYAADTSVITLAGDPTLNPTVVNHPSGITADKSGNIFISDSGGRILEIVAATNSLYSIAGKIGGVGYTEDKGTAAVFNYPQGLTTDASGNVYVADYNNNVIRKLVVSTTP